MKKKYGGWLPSILFFSCLTGSFLAPAPGESRGPNTRVAIDLPRNINAFWGETSSSVLILPTREKDQKAQEAIHEYARNIFITKRNMISERDVMLDEEVLKQEFFKKGKQGYITSDTPDVELPPLSRRQMEEDFDALVRITKEVMPTAAANKRVFGLDVFGTLEGLKKKISGITSTEEFITLLAEAIHSCKGSHFGPARLNRQSYRSNEYLRDFTKGFIDESSVRVHENYLYYLTSKYLISPLDLSLIYLDGGYYTLHDFVHEGTVFPQGLKVLSCNGESPAAIVPRLQNRMDFIPPWDFERKTFYSEEFYRAAEFPRNGILEFEFQAPSGKIVKAAFSAASSVDKKLPQRDTSKQVRYLDKEEILYIRVPVMDRQDLEFYASGIQKEGKKGELRAIVIDIRNNGGGSDSVWQAILANLVSRTIEYRQKLGLKDSQTNRRYVSQHGFGEIFLPNCRPEKIPFLDDEAFLVYSDISKIEPAKETLGFRGPIFVFSEKVYSAAGSLVTLAAQTDNIISLGFRNPYILGMGIDPYYFSLPHSKFIFTIEPVIDLTNCRTAEDVFHTSVEVEFKPTLEEMMRYSNFEDGIKLEDFLRNQDPFFKKVHLCLSLLRKRKPFPGFAAGFSRS